MYSEEHLVFIPCKDTYPKAPRATSENGEVMRIHLVRIVVDIMQPAGRRDRDGMGWG